MTTNESVGSLAKDVAGPGASDLTVSHTVDRLARREAFSETSDPAAYVPRAETEKALESIRVWAESDGRGSTIAAIVGTPGLGKTLMLRVIESRMNEARDGDVRAIYLPYAGLSPTDLSIWVHGLLGRVPPHRSPHGSPSPPVEVAAAGAGDTAGASYKPSGMDVARKAMSDLAALANSFREPFFMLFDDADSLPAETLGALVEHLPPSESRLRILMALNPDSKATRLLSSLHTFAPPQVSLRTRMSAEETEHYLRRRMEWAGLPAADIARLEDGLAYRLHSLSGGVPRALHAEASAVFEGGGTSAGSPAKSDHKQAKRALDAKRQREDWMGRPIEDDLEI